MGIWDKIKKAIGIADNDDVEDADTKDNNTEQAEETEPAEDNNSEQTEEAEPTDVGEAEENQESNAT